MKNHCYTVFEGSVYIEIIQSLKGIDCIEVF